MTRRFSILPAGLTVLLSLSVFVTPVLAKVKNIADGAVTTDTIADGAVTAEKLDPSLLPELQDGLGKIATVAKSAGDYASPIDAMANISAWCGSPAVENPCMIYLAPGVYDVGATPLYMQSHVSLVGSGQEATYIVGAVNSAALLPDGGPGVINGADVSEIRHLTVPT